MAHYIASGGSELSQATMNYCMVFLSLRVILGGSIVSHKLQAGISIDIRNIMFELGLTPQFMQQAMASSAG